jgi:hypothetical protein
MAVAKRTRTNAKKTQVDFMKGVNNIGTPVALGCGMVAGKWAIKKLSNSKTVSGLLGTDNVKKYLIPGGVAMAGLITPQFSKNKMVQMVGYGVATAGVENVVETFTGKTLMGGLADLLGGNDDTNQIPLNTMARVRSAQALPSADLELEAELSKPYAQVQGPTDNLIYSDTIGEADEYDEEGGTIDQDDPFSGDIPQ